MAWTIEFDPRAVRDLKKLDRPVQRRVLSFLRDRVASAADPRSIGEALAGPQARFWKYRLGDFRIICQIRDAEILVLVVRIGHRSDVYR